VIKIAANANGAPWRTKAATANGQDAYITMDKSKKACGNNLVTN